MENKIGYPHLEAMKPPNELTSHRLISLLPIVSKIFEKLLLKGSSKLLKIMDLYQIISSASERGTP
jgi:hypothetical protein